jgi:serine/threonine protein phosphatase 1
MASSNGIHPARSERFAVLRRCRRVWAIAASHGNAAGLARQHAAIDERMAPGDRLVYLGNWLGRGTDIAATVDEMVRFRRDTIARPGFFAADVVFLRGMQEEMLQKCLQLQFAVNPGEVLRWMLDQGLAATLVAYDCDPKAGLSAAREGATALTRWTVALRRAFDARPGHREVALAMRRAAHDDRGRLLFVSAGLDPARPLAAQGDVLWWGGGGFERLAAPFENFARVVRGYAPAHPGAVDGTFALTLDGGSGFGGPLLAAALGPDGEILEILDGG